jgi:hypothetical protein
VKRCTRKPSAAAADGDLREGDELVGLVGMRDRPGAANDCRDRGLVKEPAFGTETDLLDAFAPESAAARCVISDEGEVGAAARGIEGDEPADHVQAPGVGPAKARFDVAIEARTLRRTSTAR